jgi:hypothetical protein
MTGNRLVHEYVHLGTRSRSDEALDPRRRLDEGACVGGPRESGSPGSKNFPTSPGVRKSLRIVCVSAPESRAPSPSRSTLGLSPQFCRWWHPGASAFIGRRGFNGAAGEKICAVRALARLGRRDSADIRPSLGA